jgi:hypothetical protein
MPTLGRIVPILTYQDIPAAHDFLVEAEWGWSGGGPSGPRSGPAELSSRPRILAPRFGRPSLRDPSRRPVLWAR